MRDGKAVQDESRRRRERTLDLRVIDLAAIGVGKLNRWQLKLMLNPVVAERSCGRPHGTQLKVRW